MGTLSVCVCVLFKASVNLLQGAKCKGSVLMPVGRGKSRHRFVHAQMRMKAFIFGSISS